MTPRDPTWDETKSALKRHAGRPIKWCENCHTYIREERFEGHLCSKLQL